MPKVHIEVFGTQSAADTKAQALQLPPLKYTDVRVLKADDLIVKIPDNNPSTIVKTGRFVVVGNK